jgi:PD-(D/E)XK nuclease superfamily
MTAPSHLIAGTSLQFAWDSTSLGEFMSCAYRYKLSILDGWQSRGSRIELTFGLLFHWGLEHFERLLQTSLDREAALFQMIRDLLARTKGTEIEAIDASDGLRFIDNKRTPYTLVRSIVWYIDEYEHDPYTTVVFPDGRLGLELRFQFEVSHFTYQGQPFLISGHLDRLASTADDEVRFHDRKTTAKTINTDWFSGFDLSLQMDIYTLGSKIVFDQPLRGGVIDGAQLAVGFNRFERGLIRRTPDTLAESMRLIEHQFRLAVIYAEEDYYPQNKQACFLCAFKRICSQPPSIRSEFLKADFLQREERWNPLKLRS